MRCFVVIVAAIFMSGCFATQHDILDLSQQTDNITSQVIQPIPSRLLSAGVRPAVVDIVCESHGGNSFAVELPQDIDVVFDRVPAFDGQRKSNFSGFDDTFDVSA